MVLKKVLSFFMALLIVLMPVVRAEETEEEKDPINVYIFYGETCDFCASLHEYMDELENDDSINYMFQVVDFEVWNNAENNALMLEVGDYFGYDVTGVPFYVIGETYFTGYSESNSQDQIVEAIETAYNDPEYEDIVAGINGGEITVPDSDLTEEDEAAANDRVGLIILGITAAIVIAIIFGRSKNSYYDDDDDKDVELEEEEDEQEEKDEEEEKSKAASKKSSTKTVKKSSDKTINKTSSKSSGKSTSKTANKTTTAKKNTKNTKKK